ncbi:MAG: response regulator [Deltaproteobacteria bacterium]|nr:response regulator [Deltaproteobacteria bacterium]
MRVLVVDDHPDTADALEIVLKAAGHVVQTAYSGTDAVQLANEFAPDLAFVDIQLPDISGFAVAKELRKQSGRVNIVAITGGDSRKLPFASNFDQHLVKPVSAKQIYQLIEVAREAIKVA